MEKFGGKIKEVIFFTRMFLKFYSELPGEGVVHTFNPNTWEAEAGGVLG